MADNDFPRVPQIDFDPIIQEEANVEAKIPSDSRGPSQSSSEQDVATRRAPIALKKLQRTRTFLEWLRDLLDDRFAGLAVQVDADNSPQVWMAMQRIFDAPDPILRYSSYVEVVAALEQIEQIEADEANAGLNMAALEEDLANHPNFISPVDSATPTMTVPDEELLEFAEAIRPKRYGSGAVIPEPKKTPKWAEKLMTKIGLRGYTRTARVYDKDDI